MENDLVLRLLDGPIATCISLEVDGYNEAEMTDDLTLERQSDIFEIAIYRMTVSPDSDTGSTIESVETGLLA